MDISTPKRDFLKLALWAALCGASPAAFAAKSVLKNPCLSPALPEALAGSPILARVWEGLNPENVWDMHLHLTGMGDGNSGVVVGPKMKTLKHPFLNLQRLFYINGACAQHKGASVDENYVNHLVALVENMPKGFKTLLFAFDWFCDQKGDPVSSRSTFYVPNGYARRVAATYPHVFSWVASIHPYRKDAVKRLEAAVAGGAKAVKWLPAAQNIDPDSPSCDAFFEALAQLNIPLITHCGAEKATIAGNLEYLGNPLKLRRALDKGVRVVVAHCATHGSDEDLDKPGKRLASFALFSRMMDDPRWKDRLYGDISAITLRNRKPAVIKVLLARKDWHPRLLNGSDYPLPGIYPLMSAASLAREGLIPQEAVKTLELLRGHNPIYFDFALKRLMSRQGDAFLPQVFETRPFFEPTG
jgi:mannonate dehydratase